MGDSKTARLYAARPAALIVAVWVLITHFTVVALFSSGFLLTRTVLESTSTEAAYPALFDRAVILVIDALRYDFAAPATVTDLEKAPFYLNHMPFSSIETDPSQSFLLKFLADPPTTTLQRLKGLTTGSLPTFIDAGSNFAGTEISEDNWVSQAAQRHGPVSFCGDDTWQALFGHIFNESYPYDSLNVRDLDTVDNGVRAHMPNLIKNTKNKIVVGHMLGIDHVGHRYGPNHRVMKDKMLETFDFVKELADLIDDNTVLIVFGDHGMDQTGNHGGDSADELEAAFWAYTKKPNMFSQDGSDTVRQIDFVPTISAWLGIPKPYNNLGFPIRQGFSSISLYQDHSLDTARQISTYGSNFDKPQFGGSSVSDAKRYQLKVLEEFTASWATFNLPRMFLAIGLLITSIVSMSFLYNAVHPVNLLHMSRNMSIGGVLGLFAGTALLIQRLNLRPIVLEAVLPPFCGMSIGATLGSFVSMLYRPLAALSKPTILATLIVVFQILTVFSNSYVIWEPRIYNFLIATVLLGMLMTVLRSDKIVKALGVPYILSFAAFVRLMSLIRVCREENGPGCVSTFYEDGSSVTPRWALMTFSLASMLLPIMIARFYTIGGNYFGVAKMFIRGSTVMMIFSTLYWSIDTAEVRGYLNPAAFEIFKVFLARLIMGISLFGGIYVWYRSPLAMAVTMGDDRPKIEGFTNLYGSYGMLTVLAFVWGLFVVNKPPGLVVLSGLLYLIFVSLDLLDLTSTKYTLLPAVMFNILGQIAFYATGHQATLVSIQWDTAFIASAKLAYPMSAITVFLNTMGPILLTAIASVLVATWRRPPFKDPVLLLTYVLRGVLSTSCIAAVQAAASMVAATMLRRHLMTWKIFAPRFMYGSISLLVIDVGAIIGLLVAGHSIKKVTVIFE